MSTQASKDRRAKNLNQGKCELQDLAEEHNFRIEHITEYQIRVNGVLDVYPTNKKFCNLKTKVWGEYKDVKGLLKVINQNV